MSDLILYSFPLLKRKKKNKNKEFKKTLCHSIFSAPAIDSHILQYLPFALVCPVLTVCESTKNQRGGEILLVPLPGKARAHCPVISVHLFLSSLVAHEENQSLFCGFVSNKQKIQSKEQQRKAACAMSWAEACAHSSPNCQLPEIF